MKNLSLTGEKVSFFCQTKKFLVFDILYIEDMQPVKSLFTSNLTIDKIESEIFEWSDGQQLGFYELDENFDFLSIEISDIKLYNSNKMIVLEKIFGTDTGVIAIVDWKNISSFLDLFSYDDFVDTLPHHEKSQKYLKDIESVIGNSFAIISTPGINKGYDFVGSGRYYIESNYVI